jgi:hypothetical protein
LLGNYFAEDVEGNVLQLVSTKVAFNYFEQKSNLFVVHNRFQFIISVYGFVVKHNFD